MNTNFDWDFIFKNIVPIIAAIITVSAMIFVNTYFKPDVWYEEGSYYRSGDRAITSLKVQNCGHEDAGVIHVTVSFPDTILDVTTGDPALPFTVISGGNGTRAVSGTIERLVPEQSVYLYFAVKGPEGPILGGYQTFVAPNGIVYKGGIAKEGKPFPWSIVIVLVAGFSVISSLLVSGFRNTRLVLEMKTKVEKQSQEAKEKLKEFEERGKEMDELLEVTTMLLKKEADKRGEDLSVITKPSEESTEPLKP